MSKGMLNTAVSKPSTHIHFEGAHAKALAKHKVGAKVKMTISGTKHSHYQNADGTHSVGVTVTSVSPAGDNEKKGQKEPARTDEI